MTEQWIFDWPTEPGWYWFYGKHYGINQFRMGVVQVWENGTRILDGKFMYQQEGHVGVFQRIPTPVVPADIAAGKGWDIE